MTWHDYADDMAARETEGRRVLTFEAWRRERARQEEDRPRDEREASDG